MAAARVSRPDFHLGDWLVRPSLATVERGTETRHVTPRSMAVLLCLADAGGKVVSRNEILDTVWPGMAVTPDALSQCVVELRKVFHDDPRQPGVIQTIPKLGLRLVAPVAPVAADSTAVASIGTVASTASRSRSARITLGMSLLAMFIGGAALLWRSAYDQRTVDPLAGARFTQITEFIGAEEQAAISPDGRFIAFVSDRDGDWDVFVTQTGTGDFQNLTHGRIPDLRNPAVRMLDFAPGGSDVLIWSSSNRGWSVPVLGGELHPGPSGIAEVAWSRDRRRVVYHPAAPGDPLSIAPADDLSAGQRLYLAPPGVHCHFPVWSWDGRTIYFVRGFAPDEMDLWEVDVKGGEPRRLTSHHSRVSFPVLLDERTLLYLATSADGSGPWIHALDLQSRRAQRLISASNAYSSLAMTADGRHLVVTEPRPVATLWSVPVSSGMAAPQAVTPIPIVTQRGVAPRIGPRSLLYRAPKAGTDALWERVGAGGSRELWSGKDGRVIDGPVLSADGRQIAFTVQNSGRTWLYVMSADGSGARRIARDLDVRGAPAWSPDGKWIAIAALHAGEPRLFKVPVGGGTATLLTGDYAIDPTWSPSGRFLVYSAADLGTVFKVGAISAEGAARAIAPISLTRGSRRLAFLGSDDNTLVVLKGSQSHKEFWAVDLQSGAARALTAFGPGQTIGDFDVASDGSRIVFDRRRDESDLWLITRNGDSQPHGGIFGQKPDSGGAP